MQVQGSLSVRIAGLTLISCFFGGVVTSVVTDGRPILGIGSLQKQLGGASKNGAPDLVRGGTSNIVFLTVSEAH